MRAEDNRGALVRGIPSLHEWLGSAPLGEGFADFEAWVRSQLDQPAVGLPAAEAKMVRITQTFMVACVEQLNRETTIDPTDEGAIQGLQMWARGAGFVLICALASVAVENAPLRSLVRIFVEEFRQGAKMAADAQASEVDRGR